MIKFYGMKMWWDYHLIAGLFTWLNSRHMNRPPGFRTLYASSRACWTLVTFRIPNAIVYRSIELSSKGSCWASAHSQDKTSFSATFNLKALSLPTSSMAWFISQTIILEFPPCSRTWRAILKAMSPEGTEMNNWFHNNVKHGKYLFLQQHPGFLLQVGWV